MSVEHRGLAPDPVTGATPLTQKLASALLHNIIKDCKGQRLFFDLDSTLLDNRMRNVIIMREFADVHDIPLLSQASKEHFPTWSARDSMVLMGLPEADADRLLDDYLDFWAVRFFSSEYCRYDTEIAGAVRFVNAVQRSGGVVNYLTGRDETMRDGTTSSLASLGFPHPEKGEVKLIMKPSADDSDDRYKLDELRALSASGSIAAAFDNEPSHINAYRTVFSEAICVHLDTDHSMREVRLLDGIVSIKDFDH
ncbi:MAG: HAD family acid phosphatase [Granulosicoccus sp.]